MAGAFLLRPFSFLVCLGLLLFGRHLLVLAGRGLFRDGRGIYFHLIPVEEKGRRIVTDDRSGEANAVVLGQAGDVRLRSFLGGVGRSGGRSGGPDFYVHVRGGGVLHFVFVGAGEHFEVDETFALLDFNDFADNAGKLRAANGEPGLFGFVAATTEIGQNG